MIVKVIRNRIEWGIIQHALTELLSLEGRKVYYAKPRTIALLKRINEASFPQPINLVDKLAKHHFNGIINEMEKMCRRSLDDNN